MVLVPISVAAIEIPKNCRMSNEPAGNPGYCAWVSIEVLGKVHGISQLNGLKESRKKDPDLTFVKNGQLFIDPKNIGYGYAVRNKLRNLHVRFWMYEDYNRSLLPYANSHGCYVTLKP